MKVLSLGIDNSILDKKSKLAERVVEYGQLVDKYTVMVPAPESTQITLSDKVEVFSAKSPNKIIGLLNIYKLAKNLLRENKYDVITSQDPYFIGLIAIWLGKKFSIGVEIQVHGWENDFFRKLLSRFILSRANSIRVVSQRLQQQLIEDFKIGEEKITAVPIYVEIQDSRFKIHELRIVNQKPKFIFLTVGRLVPVKNIEMQIKSMAEIVKKYPNIELWIVGDGPEKKSLQLLADSLKLSEKVKFLGWQGDLTQYYSKADVLLLTSNSEGWGMVVIEAANHGLPVMMTDVGCAGEIIKNDESGLIIPIGDTKALIEAMNRLIQDSGFRIKLGQRAQEAVKKLPTKEETLDLYKKSWQKALL